MGIVEPGRQARGICQRGQDSETVESASKVISAEKVTGTDTDTLESCNICSYPFLLGRNAALLQVRRVRRLAAVMHGCGRRAPLPVAVLIGAQAKSDSER